MPAEGVGAADDAVGCAAPVATRVDARTRHAVVLCTAVSAHSGTNADKTARANAVVIADALAETLLALRFLAAVGAVSNAADTAFGVQAIVDAHARATARHAAVAPSAVHALRIPATQAAVGPQLAVLADAAATTFGALPTTSHVLADVSAVALLALRTNPSVLADALAVALHAPVFTTAVHAQTMSNGRAVRAGAAPTAMLAVGASVALSALPAHAIVEAHL